MNTRMILAYCLIAAFALALCRASVDALGAAPAPVLYAVAALAGLEAAFQAKRLLAAFEAWYVRETAGERL